MTSQPVSKAQASANVNQGAIARALRAGAEYRALELVIVAYRAMVADGTYDAGWHENRLSAVLKARIEANCQVFSRKTGLIWHAEREEYNDNEAVSQGNGNPDKAPRIDIVLYSWRVPYSKQRFPFECKRVAEHNSDLIRRYVEQGVTRYLEEDKDYGAGGRWGGMVAYIIEGDIDSIVGRINNQIVLQLGDPPQHEPLRAHTRITEFSTIFASRHYYSKINGHLRITHLFLSFR